jgi:hypothetical protein
MFAFFILYHIVLFAFFILAPVLSSKLFASKLSFLLFSYFAARFFFKSFTLTISKALFCFAFALVAGLFLFSRFTIGTFLCLKDQEIIYNRSLLDEGCNYCIEILIQDLFYINNLSFYCFLALFFLKIAF